MTDLSEFFGEPIASYSRAQAIDDGVLFDLAIYQIDGLTAAAQAGILYPVAVTAGVWSECIGPEHDSPAPYPFALAQAGLLCDELARQIRLCKGGDTIHLSFASPGTGELVKLWAKCGPGDQAEPVITVMLEGED